MPWCFFTGCVDDHDALDCFCRYGISYLEDRDEIENTLNGQNGNSLIHDETYSETIAIHIVKACCSDDHPVQIGLFHEGVTMDGQSAPPSLYSVMLTPHVHLLL